MVAINDIFPTKNKIVFIKSAPIVISVKHCFYSILSFDLHLLKSMSQVSDKFLAALA